MKLKYALLGVLAVLAIPLIAHAQSYVGNGGAVGNGSTDPCVVYPKQSVYMPVQAATANLVPGVAGKQIYVCSVSTTWIGGSTTGATPSLQLLYGQLWSATPCGTATATTPVQVGWFGGSGTTTTYGANGGTLIQIPISASSPVTGLCGWSNTGAAPFAGGVVTYVQIQP